MYFHICTCRVNVASTDPASNEDPHHDPETPGEATREMFTHQRARTIAKRKINIFILSIDIHFLFNAKKKEKIYRKNWT